MFIALALLARPVTNTDRTQLACMFIMLIRVVGGTRFRSVLTIHFTACPVLRYCNDWRLVCLSGRVEQQREVWSQDCIQRVRAEFETSLC